MFREMRAPLDLLPFALLALATIVGVAVVLVLSDLLRRFVLFAISALSPARPPGNAPAETPAPASRERSASADRDVLPG